MVAMEMTVTTQNVTTMQNVSVITFCVVVTFCVVANDLILGRLFTVEPKFTYTRISLRLFGVHMIIIANRNQSLRSKKSR